MPSQALSVGACANSQGHGTLQLQMSNQSPARRHSGTVLTTGLPTGSVADFAFRNIARLTLCGKVEASADSIKRVRLFGLRADLMPLKNRKTRVCHEPGSAGRHHRLHGRNKAEGGLLQCDRRFPRELVTNLFYRIVTTRFLAWGQSPN
jgi:hypothetical protein